MVTYKIRVNKHFRYLKVYTILKNSTEKTNVLTKLFIKIFSGKSGKANGGV